MSTRSAAAPAVPSSREGSPLVSVLMTTLPAARMRQRDAARLDALLRRFEHALERRPLPDVDTAELVRRVRRVAEAAAHRPTRRGIGLFVGEDVDRTVALPQPVSDRVVVDEHFDTRDLLYADQYNPPFRVLLVQDGIAHAYDSRADEALVEREDHFPIAGPPALDAATFERLVAEEIEALDADEPRPLVLALNDRGLASAVAAKVAECAGRLERIPARVRPDVLHRLAHGHLVRWRADRARAAIPEPDDPAWVRGSGAVQRAVAAAPGGTMIVEANFNDAMPRSIHVHTMRSRGDRPIGINAAIARVRAAGGAVLFVEDGDLRHFDGVAYRPAA